MPKARVFSGGLSSIDMLFMLLLFFRIASFLILFSLQSAAVVNQFGYVWDVLGGYLALRFLIQDQADIERAIGTFAFIASVLRPGAQARLQALIELGLQQPGAIEERLNQYTARFVE